MMLDTGDIITVKDNKSIISKILTKFSKDEYPHVGMHLTHGIIIESYWSKGTVLNHISKYEKVKYDYKVLRNKKKLSETEQKNLFDFTISKIYSKYDYKLLLDIGKYLTIGKLNKKTRINNNLKKYICVELIAAAYKSIDKSIFGEKDSSVILSKDFRNSDNFEEVYEKKRGLLK